MDYKTFEKILDVVLARVGKLLKEKNRSYGGSAVDPLNLFTKVSVKERLLVRIEDKIKRIQTLGPEGYGEDNVFDLVGYFLIYMVQDAYEKKLEKARDVSGETS